MLHVDSDGRIVLPQTFIEYAKFLIKLFLLVGKVL